VPWFEHHQVGHRRAQVRARGHDDRRDPSAVRGAREHDLLGGQLFEPVELWIGRRFVFDPA